MYGVHSENLVCGILIIWTETPVWRGGPVSVVHSSGGAWKWPKSWLVSWGVQTQLSWKQCCCWCKLKNLTKVFNINFSHNTSGPVWHPWQVCASVSTRGESKNWDLGRWEGCSLLPADNLASLHRRPPVLHLPGHAEGFTGGGHPGVFRARQQGVRWDHHTSQSKRSPCSSLPLHWHCGWGIKKSIITCNDCNYLIFF